jgi:two-component system phosphate regulon sensor histidine kinase PhoR
MGYRRIVLLLLYLGVIPGVLLSAIGVLLLVVGEARFNLLMGILVLTFTGTLVTGVILVWVFVHRERNLSELQADFVSKVSHELRTPLTSIRIFTETLKLRRGDVATEDRCIEALDRESARRYRMERHPIAAIVEEAVESFQPTRERDEGSVELELDLPKGLPELRCDRGAFVDALVNLLSNAYKYGGSPKRITVRAEADRNQARISVSDNGPGIPRREHKRIFMKFYRVDDKLTRKAEGSGLGLAIVKHVARGHGGHVRVDSSPGAGSTFTLELPLERRVSDLLDERSDAPRPSRQPVREDPAEGARAE